MKKLCYHLFILVSVVLFFGNIQHVNAAGDSTENAEAIELNKKVKGNLPDQDAPINWYKLTTGNHEHKSWYELSMIISDRLYGVGHNSGLRVYNEDKEQLIVLQTDNENRNYIDYVMLDSNTTYYVSFSGAPCDYVFNIKYTGDEISDTIQGAYNLEPNKAYKSAMHAYGDIDYYSFMALSEKIQLEIKNSSVQRGFFVDILDEDGILLESFNAISIGTAKTISLSVSKGSQYYVRLSNIPLETLGNYSIKIINEVNVKKIKLNMQTKTMKNGTTLQLKYTITPNNASNNEVTWKSSNKKVVTVNSKGKVVAKGKGTATITCTAKDGSKIKATCKISVK